MKSQGYRRLVQDDAIYKPQVFFLFFCLLGGAFSIPAFGKDDGEYSFKWLDPDKKIYVLQNRKYLKTERVLVSALGGIGLSGAYRENFNVQARMNYYFSEQWGIEGFFGITSNSENSTFEALQQTSPAALPIVREIRSEFGVLGQWAPWYSKINVFNTILYFDWYFSLGFGRINAELDTNQVAGDPSVFVKDNQTAIYLGSGQQFHINRNWVARVDFLGAFFRAPILGNSGDKVWFSNFNFNLGVGYRF